MHNGRIVSDPDLGHGPLCEPMTKVCAVARGMKRDAVGGVQLGESQKVSYRRVNNTKAALALQENVDYFELDDHFPSRREVCFSLIIFLAGPQLSGQGSGSDPRVPINKPCSRGGRGSGLNDLWGLNGLAIIGRKFAIQEFSFCWALRGGGLRIEHLNSRDHREGVIFVLFFQVLDKIRPARP